MSTPLSTQRSALERADKDLRHLATVFERTGGKAWEPPLPGYPWLVRMIEAGYLRRVDMRCGFEAMKDAGLVFTDAGRRAVISLDFQDIVERLATFDARNSIVHLREMARKALIKAESGK